MVGTALSIATRGYLEGGALDVATRGYLASVVAPPSGGGGRGALWSDQHIIIMPGEAEPSPLSLSMRLGKVGAVGEAERWFVGAVAEAGATVGAPGLVAGFRMGGVEARGVKNLTDEELAVLMLWMS